MQQKSTILIVDDELSIRDIFKSIFSKEDYNLVFAMNGVEALEKAKEITLDLILLDVIMPDMDGFEVCRRLRNDPLMAEVPIIMVTTMFDRETRLLGIKAGADDFITKPFDIEDLESRVKTITRLNRYRKLLVERSKSELLIELSPEGIIIVDVGGVITLANSAMKRMLGSENGKDIIGKKMTSFIVPERSENCSNFLDKVLKGSSHHSVETSFVSLDGKQLPVEIIAANINWKDEPSIYIMVRDITERKRAEEVLKENEEKYRLLVENLNDVIFTLDLEGNVTYVSPMVEKLSGYKPEEFLNKPFIKYIHPDDLSGLMNSREHELAGEMGTNEYRFAVNDGTYRHILSSSQVIFEKDKPVGFVGIVKDITDRKIAEESLREEKERAQQYLDIVEVILLVLNTKGEITLINRKGSSVLGYEEGELIGKNWFDTCLPDEIKKEVRKIVHELIKGEKGKFEYHENPILSKSGKERIVAWHNTILKDEDGNAIGILSSGEDITDRKQAEDGINEVNKLLLERTVELIESEEKYRILVENANDGIIILQDALFKYTNQRTGEITGYRVEELIDTGFINYIHPDEVAKLADLYNRHITGEVTISIEESVLIHKDGHNVDFEFNASNFTYNKEPAILVIVRDITERKKVEEKLIEKEERYRSLVENLNDVVFNIDLDGNFTYISPIIEKISGYKVDEFVGQSIADYMHPEDLSRVKAIFEQDIASRNETNEFRVIEKDGSTRYVSISGRVQWKNKKPIGITGIMTDVTDSRMMREELKAAKIRAEQSNRAKSEFLANMSHEIRTPMNAVLGFSELLMEEDLTEEQKENVKTIYESGNILLSLINDILDLSKIESGKVEIFEQVFYLLELLNNTIALLSPKADEKGLKLNLKIDKDISSQIVSDPDKIRQIIINLLGNAIKFSGAGKIDVSVKMSVKDDEKDILTISVKDTGIGIPLEKIETIFDPFSQVDTSTTRLYGGTGLGLSITKNLVELLGGKIKVSSKVEKGSTFTFSIPVKRPVTEDKEEQIVESKKVLIVEDDVSTLRLYRKFLEKNGYEVISSKLGKDALPLAEKHLPAIIILDVILPDILGWEVLRQLKNSKKAANIPVIVVSVLPEKNKAISLGAIDYAEKPITGGSLVKKIETLTKTRKRKVDLKILIVDDDKPVLDFLSEMLKEEGFTTIPFTDPEEAIDFIRRGENSIDMIILDIYMPKITGFDFMSLLKEEGKLKDIPIIFVTGRRMSEKEMKKFAGISYTLMQKSQLTTELVVSEIDTIIKGLEDVSQKSGEKISPEIKEKFTGNILLVEDNKVNQKLITKILQNEGYTVTITGNGAEALKAIESEEFDLILMDIQMPVMDGYEATRRIKADERFSSIPVVALTAHAMSGDEQKIKEVGCDGYLTKPINREKLFKELAYQLKSRVEKEITYEDEDDEELQEIRRDYLRSLPGEVKKLKMAVEEEKFDDIYKIGHDLKGTGGAFGQEKISILGGQIEHAAKEKKTEIIQFLLESLAEETDKIVADLK